MILLTYVIDKYLQYSIIFIIIYIYNDTAYYYYDCYFCIVKCNIIIL